jgi:hypothetical protein
MLTEHPQTYPYPHPFSPSPTLVYGVRKRKKMFFFRESKTKAGWAWFILGHVSVTTLNVGRGLCAILLGTV